MIARDGNAEMAGHSKDATPDRHLVYTWWKDHAMFGATFCFPLPPDMPFQDLIDEVLASTYGMHPEFQDIDWNEVKWQLDGHDFDPVLSQSLLENGVGHKSIVLFETPGFLDAERGDV